MRHYVTGRIYQLNKKRLSSIEDEQEGRFHVLTAELEVIEVENNGIATACVAALEGSSGVRSKGSRRSIVTPARCATRDALSLFIDSNSPQQ